MREEELKFLAVSPKEHIRFKCIGCGACCKNIYLSVPIETLDAFRIAKYLRNMGHKIETMDDFWQQYGEPALLDECGYFVYFLKTKGDQRACVFLEDDRCAIHAVNPRACRLYPFTAEPDTGQYLVTREREHHFIGTAIKVKSWMNQRYSEEDRAFVRLDYGVARDIAKLLREIPEQDKARAIMLFQFYKYSAYDLDKPFLIQFEDNQNELLNSLSQLINKSKSI